MDTTLPAAGPAAGGVVVPRWMYVTAAVLLLGIVLTGVLVAVAFVQSERSLDADPRIAFLRRAVDEAPDNLALRRELASMYQQTGHYRMALQEYGRILHRDPRDLAALYGTGRIQLEQGRERAGEKALRKVLEIAPTHAYAAAALGFHLEKAGRLGEIADVVGPAAEAQPNVADLQYLMGRALENAGQNEESAEYYGHALELVPDMWAANRALMRVEAGR